jgi:hypothetical protein
MFARVLKGAARAPVFCAIFLLGPFSGGDLSAHGGGGHGGGGHGGGNGVSGRGGGVGFGGHGFAHADFGHHDFHGGFVDHHGDFHHDHFFFHHHHHPIFFGFPPSSYGYPSCYDPCDPYSPYYDPDYCYGLKYGYYRRLTQLKVISHGLIRGQVIVAQVPAVGSFDIKPIALELKRSTHVPDANGRPFLGWRTSQADKS